MDFFTEIKNLLVTLFSVTLAYFAPISDMVFVIFFIFLINMMAGLVSGIVVDNEPFNNKKFFHCIVETCVFYLIVGSVFLVGEKLNNINGALQCITGVVYAILYFYGTNTLRNLQKLFPDNKVVAFIYYVVSFEVVKKIPYLQQFQDRNIKEDKP